MNIIEIIIGSFALAADAFAVSICKGLSLKKVKNKDAIIVGLWFGIFQMLMPTIGFILGITFKNIIESIDHYIAFILLIYIGGSMIIEAFKNREEHSNSLKFKVMFILAIATSIDALSYGIAYVFGYGNKNAIICFISIGVITFITSFLGVKLGSKLGTKVEKLSQILGGIVLILLGLKILLEHLSII